MRRFWLSLDKRRMFAFHSPWSLAPGFEINPCDPDENLFVRLVRHDRYLQPTSTPVVTEYLHRKTLVQERTFLSGLAGRRVLVRTLLVVNILIWLTLEFSGGSTQPTQLIRAGAKAGGLIRAGQYWRFVTPIFLHFGLLHLVLNAAGLLFLGEVLERIYGSMQFALLYFVSGIASVVTSFLFGPELMVGASGAIFGLAGALVVYGYRYRSRIPKRHGAMFGGGLLPLIGFNIALGMFVKGIDNSAHLGGLVVGAAVALCLRPLADEVTRPSWTSRRRVAALVVLGLVAGSLLVGATSFVRFSNMYETDRRWLVKEEIPGGGVLWVPGSWVATKHTKTEAAFSSVCYDGRLEVRALDMSKDATRTFLGELVRIRTRGFLLPGDGPVMRASVMGELFQRGRVQVLMPGRGRRRQQVFILSDDTLISVGVEIAEKGAPQFAPVQDRILATLPEPR